MSVETRSSHNDGELTLSFIVNALHDEGLITDHNAQQLRFVGKTGARHPLAIVAEQGLSVANAPNELLSLERLTRWMAGRANLPYLRIDPLQIDVESVTRVVKKAYADRFNILPVEVRGDTVTVATAEPYVRDWERELSQSSGFNFERVLANPDAVERYRAEFYALTHSIRGATEQRGQAPVSKVGNFEQLVELGKTGEPDANDQHVVRVVDWLLQHAFEQRASDIHLEPRRELGNVRFRIDGKLHLVHQIPGPVLNAMTSRLKALGRMDVVERRRPQDGRIKTKSPEDKEVELRLSTMPTTFGEKLVMRIFDPEVLVRSFEALGLTPREEELWQRMTCQPHGMLVVTGPTGSGKTTTLYSALKRLAKPEINICTIEDPIELVDAKLNQMNVQPNIGIDFATGVRTLLRQDPDVIMIGEIRDVETAETAVRAALTGHLVLSTLHTNDAPAAVTRMLDLGVAPYLLKSSLIGVVAQRLVRTLCPNCKRPGRPTEAEWNALVAPAQIPRPEQAFNVGGCDDCRNTGYFGRVGLYEMLEMNESIRKLISASGETTGIRERGIKSGMVPLRIAGAIKVRAGLTTAQEVLGVLHNG